MKRISRQFIPCLLTGATILATFLHGCEEKKVFLIYDDDEIKRYISESADEPDLFRVDGLIADTPYRLPFDSAIYRDLVDSVARTIDVQIAGPFDFDYLGNTYEALATVVDRFYVRTQRTLGDDIIELPNQRMLKRYGYFLLLGDANDSFIGWKLWGFNSLGASDAPVNLSVATLHNAKALPANLTDYPHRPVGFGDFPYVRLDEIPTLQKSGDTLALSVSPRSGNLLYHLLSAEGDSGSFTRVMTRVDPTHWVDTIKTPTNNQRLWNIIFVQTFLNPQPGQYIGQYNGGWCIPYRVPQ